ncbi:hypothetical protein GH714_029398 [Hevea brasiliensis]|uniref:Uncharacterized protein n=1 Tax=Hevea brasiliensis TaxID=3981 RepID=A0A6A6L0V3_HEVBR|nr:hypothetical protein GH714_029398 [Hevea brasiliensis]
MWTVLKEEQDIYSKVQDILYEFKRFKMMGPIHVATQPREMMVLEHFKKAMEEDTMEGLLGEPLVRQGVVQSPIRSVTMEETSTLVPMAGIEETKAMLKDMLDETLNGKMEEMMGWILKSLSKQHEEGSVGQKSLN